MDCAGILVVLLGLTASVLGVSRLTTTDHAARPAVVLFYGEPGRRCRLEVMAVDAAETAPHGAEIHENWRSLLIDEEGYAILKSTLKSFSETYVRGDLAGLKGVLLGRDKARVELLLVDDQAAGVFRVVQRL